MISPDLFSLTKLSTGGLLLDLKTGSLFRLNESATTIWSEWLAGLLNLHPRACSKAYRLGPGEKLSIK